MIVFTNLIKQIIQLKSYPSASKRYQMKLNSNVSNEIIRKL